MTYRLFGVTVRSSHDFATPMWEEGELGERDPGEEEIRLTLRLGAPPAPPAADPVYATDHDADPPALRVYETSDGHDLRFAEGLTVRCEPGEIEAVAPDENALSWAEIRLLGPVLAFYLERSGLPVLHASAVDLGADSGHRAVAFLAGNRAGKSSLAAALVARGHSLLTDDLLAVEPSPSDSLPSFRGRPGYPQMRFWPDAAEYWLGKSRWFGEDRAEDLPRVHPSLDKRRVPVDRFTPEARPLAKLYLPERSEPERSDDSAEIRIEPLRPREALMELIGRSFIPRLAAAAGWEARRFGVLARLAEAVPMARLVYPSGFERLSEVVETVLDDVG